MNAASAVVPTGNFVLSERSTDLGLALGAGVEYAWTDNLTIKVEGLYVSFDDRGGRGAPWSQAIVGVTNTGAPVTATQIGWGLDDRRNRDDFFVVRAGLNWKFSTGL